MDTILGLALLVLALYPLHRLALWMEQNGWIYYRNNPRGNAFGSALSEMDAAFQPQRRHEIERRAEEKAETLLDEEDPGSDKKVPLTIPPAATKKS
jgi:hypothetical protein